MDEDYYENERMLWEYLLFHYGGHDEIMPYIFGPLQALDFPLRCAEILLSSLPTDREVRALDLGCAVGRASFELTRKCSQVVAIDASECFIQAARELRETGTLAYQRLDEGEITTPLTARVPDGLVRELVEFRVGDACRLPEGLGTFDCALLANLLCRLPEPQACLHRIPDLIRSGGFLMLTTPATWSTAFTPRENWLGGIHREGLPVTTEQGLHEALDNDFDLLREEDMPFLIREHARKFQWSVARMTLWRRR